MYFTGIAEPDREPGRNRHAAADRKSKFTEKIAEAVVDGDLYFSKQAPAHERFYVPIAAGEHGLEEPGLLCVTHKFSKRWEDMPGKWEPYDTGGNLVIKVHDTSGSLEYAALNVIERALYKTRLGRAVGFDALRDMAKSLAQSFGLDPDMDDYGFSPQAFRTNPENEQRAQEALKDLLTYAPETGYAEELGEIGAEYDNVGFAQDAAEYASVINGKSDGFGNTDNATGKPLPLMSQPVFYAVLGGKHEARGFQSRIDALMRAVGLEEDDLR